MNWKRRKKPSTSAAWRRRFVWTWLPYTAWCVLVAWGFGFGVEDWRYWVATSGGFALNILGKCEE